MKRLMITLMLGLCLVACSSPKETENNSATGNTNTNTTQNGNNTTTNKENSTDTHLSYITDLGFTDVTNANGTKYYQRYTLDETTAAQNDIYNQWMYTWVEPEQYVGKSVDVYEYTGKKDNKDYNIYVLAENGKQIGGYYYEKGKDISNAEILHTSHKPHVVEDFRSTWDKLFNIHNTNTNTTNNGTNTEIK